MNKIETQGQARPFIKWAGGKRQLLPTLQTYLPSIFRKDHEVTYVEPFVGGGAMLFFMLSTYPSIKRAVVNDINPDLIIAYQTIKDSPEQLIDYLSSIQNDYYKFKEEEERRNFYLSMRLKYNQKGLSKIENTGVLIFLNRTCFNGLYRVNSKGAYNVPFGKYTNPKICDESVISADSKLLQKVDILCGDYQRVRSCIEGDTFIYFDPPYRPLSQTSSFNTYAKESFDDDEQIRLKMFLDELRDRAFLMLSNSDCAGKDPQDTFFDDLYSNYTIRRVEASRMINAKADKRGKLKELLITNYDNLAEQIQQPQLAFSFK